MNVPAITIFVDAPTLELLRKWAARDGTSLSLTARRLLERGDEAREAERGGRN